MTGVMIREYLEVKPIISCISRLIQFSSFLWISSHRAESRSDILPWLHGSDPPFLMHAASFEKINKI